MGSIFAPEFDYHSGMTFRLIQASLLDSASGILQVLSEMSWDTLLLIVGLAFIALAVLGNISGRISPGTGGRIGAAVVGACLIAGGLWYHNSLHGFKVIGVQAAAPNSVQAACPLKVDLQGIVDASGAGDAVYNFKFSNGNASALQTVSFPGTDSRVVSGVWEIHESAPNAWIQLEVDSQGKQLLSKQSDPFSVTCLPAAVSASGPTAFAVPAGVQPVKTAASPPPPPPSPPSPMLPMLPIVKAPARVINDNADSVVFDLVEPAPGPSLKTGSPVTFGIQATYNLVSADAAFLSVSTEQISLSAKGCGAGGELVDAVQVPIVRGKHRVSVHLVWSGDTGTADKGHVYGSGYLSFSPMFWANNQGSRGARTAYFGTFSEDCYRFGP